MVEFKREIVFYENHFTSFYKKQSQIVRKKIDWTLLLISTTKVVPSKYLKHIVNSNGIWEVRVSAGSGIFRIFCIFEEENFVILLNGFQKKSQKTPKNEIKRAQRLKKEYYENRN